MEFGRINQNVDILIFIKSGHPETNFLLFSEHLKLKFIEINRSMHRYDLNIEKPS